MKILKKEVPVVLNISEADSKYYQLRSKYNDNFVFMLSKLVYLTRVLIFVMKKALNYFTFIFVSLFLYSCGDCVTGEGDAIQEKRTVANFEAIDLSSSIDVVLVQDQQLKTHKVELIAQENILPHIKFEVDDKTLDIAMKGCTIDAEDLGAMVYFKTLKKIENSGSGNVSSETPLESKILTVKTNGSGDVEFEFEGDQLVVISNGSGSVHVFGKCRDLIVKSNGSGSLNLEDLVSDRVHVNSDGSGDVRVYAVRKAILKLDGSGDIMLKGNPQNLEQNSNGSGEIKRIN